MLTVRHRHGTYDVRLSDWAGALANLPGNARCFIDENVARAWPDQLDGLAHRLIMPSGEGTKSMGQFERGLRWLAQTGARRGDPVVAIGGGVVGDLAGFVAASYMRGAPLIMVPTTLLAMVDSSVGGKVAIDLPEGKNLAGAFWPPTEVWIVPRSLDSLPEREFNAGAAEVWKYGAIMDAGLFDELRRPLAVDDERLPEIILRCLQLKARVVEADEFETTGLRAILNFGHTIGHALEAVEHYQGHKHGEAVAIGMVLEAKLGQQLGITESGTADRLAWGLRHQGLSVDLPTGIDPDALIAAMRTDKKADHDGLAFSLIPRLGECKLCRAVPESAVRDALVQA